MQDRLATALLERRGYSKFLNGAISEARFMRNLSQEWASLPKDMGGASYYAGDGLNRALTSPQEAAARVLAYLARPDFGANPVADVRD